MTTWRRHPARPAASFTGCSDRRLACVFAPRVESAAASSACPGLISAYMAAGRCRQSDILMDRFQ